ncbi:MAG: ABC-type glycerol-3-phosphate transport system substrate-binding protein [Candidatus Paceibacteria bacterium]|jgi:ABC-type glycerol-3-phosphate transport system substrate-binding protein
MKLRPFELTLVVAFGIMAMVALFIVNSYEAGPSSGVDGQIAFSGSVEIWGTLPADVINGVLRDLTEDIDEYRNVSYKYYSPSNFNDKLLRALADGEGPDLLLISQEKLVEMRPRIQPFSYEAFPIPDIRNLYLDGAQIFALSDGLYGYPIAVDPMMMYWNRNILTNQGYLEPPRTWEVLVNTMFPDLIQRNFDRTITLSVVAMGGYKNIRNAFGIISSLFIQRGSQRVGDVAGNQNKYTIKLQSTENAEGDPLKAAADFYTRFSRPSNALYSWNHALDEDRQQFVSGDLVMYFGYGSEGPQIELLNPNLNFDIAEIPQGANSNIRRTYGKFYALTMLKASDNKSAASVVMLNLSGEVLSSRIAVESNMVPVRRSIVSQGSNTIYGRATYQSAQVALGWLNPELAATDKIFETLVNDINENRRPLNEAVNDVSLRLREEY